jgi:hypothetical protein
MRLNEKGVRPGCAPDPLSFVADLITNAVAAPPSTAIDVIVPKPNTLQHCAGRRADAADYKFARG